MSGGPGTTWRRLLDDKRAAFDDLGSQVHWTISSESAFRTCFETLCRRYGEWHYTRLLANLQYRYISAFARAVDDAERHGPPNNLTGLVYGATYVAIEVSTP